MINNRQQSGRRRGRGGQRQGGGNPGGGSGGGGGNRIDNRARGNANQLYEKYKNLAADAQRQGDRVQTEYYLQFADHYYRVLAETRPRFEEQQRQQRVRDEQFDEDGEYGSEAGSDGGSDDYGDEGEAIRPGEQAQPQGGERRRFEERRPRRDEDDRRPRRDRDGRERGEERLSGQQRDDNDAVGAEPRPRRDRDGRERGEERPNGQHRDDIADVSAEPQVQMVEPDLPLPELAAEAPQPARRRGRPRKEPAEEPASFDADRLPPALGAPANDADEPAEAKPRRRRTRSAGSAEVPAAE